MRDAVRRGETRGTDPSADAPRRHRAMASDDDAVAERPERRREFRGTRPSAAPRAGDERATHAARERPRRAFHRARHGRRGGSVWRRTLK